MDLLRLPEAARRLGISTPTLKQWIYRRKVRTVKTAGGHHRVPRVEIDRLLFQGGRRARRVSSTGSGRESEQAASFTGLEHFISGRNQLVGQIIALETVGLLTKVALDIGGQKITAIITRDACRDLRLRVGEPAAALIKATEVMIIRPAPVRS